MLEELDVVRVKRAMPSSGIAMGAEGTIVHALTEPSTAYLVEFTDSEGRTIATEVFQPEDLEQVWSVRLGQPGQRRAA